MHIIIAADTDYWTLQGRNSPVPNTPVNVAFWLMAPAGQVGMIIGRGGDVIRRIRNETDARVKVHTGAGMPPACY